MIKERQNLIIKSMREKNVAVKAAIIKTITVVNSVSLRVGQTTFETSALTCWIN